MAKYTKSMQILIEEFLKMPGVGKKSAERMAFYILKADKKDVAFLASAIMTLKAKTGLCKICNNLSEGLICEICQDTRRDKSIVCVVEGPSDIIALERAGRHNGLYHVLMGTLSPLEGIGPEDIRIKELVDRIRTGDIKEVIIATDCDTEGEATALYLVNIFKPLKIMVSQIACGIPVGSNVEYADHATLAKAIEGRRAINY